MSIILAFGSIFVPASIFEVHYDLIRRIASRSYCGVDLFAESAKRQDDMISIPWWGESTGFERENILTWCLTDTRAGQEFAEILSSKKVALGISYERCTCQTRAMCDGWLIPVKNSVKLWQYRVETDARLLPSQPADIKDFDLRLREYILTKKKSDDDIQEAVCF